MSGHNGYRSIRAVNWSSLREMRVSELAYHDALTTPVTETPAMTFGRAAHCALLEPDRFPRDFVLYEGRRGTNEYKAFALANHDKTILRAEDYERVLAVRDAVRRHPAARKYLRHGKAEVTLTWRDPLTGLRCKGRLDKVSRNWWLEFKTTASLDARKWSYRVRDMAYDGQLGFYDMGLRANGLVRAPVMIVAENEHPFDVGVFPVPEDVILGGYDLAADLLRTLVRCRQERRWPGRYPEATPLQMAPRWNGGNGEHDLSNLIDFQGAKYA